MEMAGLILVGIGVNTFINGVWLILYNSQNKNIENQNKNIANLENNLNERIENLESSLNKLLNKE